MPISAQKIAALQTENKKFCLLELDNLPKMAQFLGLDETIPTTQDSITELLTHFNTVLSPEVTGVLLDPVYGFSTILDKSSNAGVVLRLEQIQAEVDPLSVPKLINNWGIEDIKNNYGSAKLELYYHPDEEKALEKKQLVAELYDYCQHEDVPFVLKLTIYTPADEEFSQISFQESQLTAVQEFRTQCDVLILQYPQDPLATATVTAEIDIPWLFEAEGINYDAYKQMLRTSLENGAAGFVANESVWKEIENFKLEDSSPDFNKINTFIETIVRDRMIEMMRIVTEHA